MIGLAIFSTCALVIEQQKLHEAREEWISTLPKEEQEKIRKQDEIKRQELLSHQRAIEVAEAGRARNFWGK